MSRSTTDRYCILGAGSSGLAIAKNFLQAGIPFDCLEREEQIGGIWNYGKHPSSVYASTRLISSKRITEYTDFPLPEDYPEFPGYRLVLEYFCNYARHFGLREHIQINTSVERLQPVERLQQIEENGSDAGWEVRLAGGESRTYRGVVIANGHCWDPLLPEYPGEFTGTVLHSSEYRIPKVLRGKHVLVVGGGNSGCDLAVEAAIHSERAILSLRRGYHILPKFFKGKPIDEFNESLLRWRIPLWARRLAARLVIRWVLGRPEVSGLPRPTHRLFESHPIINSQLHGQAAHGNLVFRPDVQQLLGDRVRFVDGTRERVDVILYATGFRISFPFIDHQHLNWQEGRPELFLNMFHPQRGDLFCAGLIQPDSGQWGLVDYQAQLITRYLQAKQKNPQLASWFDRLKQSPVRKPRSGIRYLDTPRHRLEVEHFSYRRQLQKLIEKLKPV